MQYAERLPTLPSPRAMVVPVVALVIGAGAATGAYALLDDDGSGPAPSTTKVIVAEPVQPGAGVAAKDEAAVAAAISNSSARPATEVKDEAAIAAAVGQANHHGEFSGSTASQYGTSQHRLAPQKSGTGVELRGSKASADGTSQSALGQAQSGARP